MLRYGRDNPVRRFGIGQIALKELNTVHTDHGESTVSQLLTDGFFLFDNRYFMGGICLAEGPGSTEAEFSATDDPKANHG